MNKNEITKIISDVNNRECDYFRITQLPSNFRSYPIKSINVRGLFHIETKNLSKYIGIGNPTYTQLYNTYKDVIKGFDIKDLELVDFIVLTIISSIWTVDGFGWIPNVRCSHHEPNLNEDGDRIPCSGIIVDKIVLDDFDFKEPKISITEIPLKIGEQEILIGPVTLGSMIEREEYKTLNPDIDLKTLEYASIIKKIDGEYSSIDDRVKFIDYSFSNELIQINSIYSDLHIKTELIQKECPVCKKKTGIKINLNEIRGYPSL